MTEEVTDEELKVLEEELKKLEGKDSDYGSPKSSEKDNLFKFFRTILAIKDTTRVANLTRQELGISDISVRGWKRIARYAKEEGLDVVADYFDAQSEIMTSTSMSIKGFWSQNFVTQIKKEGKIKDKTEKKGWFSKKTEEAE